MTDEDGCHLLHIHGELRKLLIYRGLSKAVVQQCLSELDTQSDVIETAHQRYITVH